MHSAFHFQQVMDQVSAAFGEKIPFVIVIKYSPFVTELWLNSGLCFDSVKHLKICP